MFGVDLARWWQDRRWVALLELIDQLPQASRLNEALQNDPEQAKILAELRAAQTGDKEGPEWSPRLAEFDLHAQLLRDVIQSLVGVQTTLIAVNSEKKPKQPKPYPVPVTEVDRAVERANRVWADTMTDLLIPKK